jgi:acetyl esterase/lipase
MRSRTRRPTARPAHLQVAAEPEVVVGRSLRSRALGLGLRATVRPLLDAWALTPFRVVPPNVLEHGARLLPVPSGTVSERVDLPECHGEWVRGDGIPALEPGAPVVLYLHGGGFLSCGLTTHRGLVSRLSSRTGQPVLSVAYGQMPRHSIADSVSHCVAALGWLREQGVRTEDVTLVGDSAGGYLAFCVARAAIDAGWGTPAGVVGLSPLLDLDPTRKLAHPNARTCHTFSAAAIARLIDLADHVDTRLKTTAPRLSPVDMRLDDMPPVLLQVGSREVVLADAELMANRLHAAGVPATLQVWDGQVHVFQMAAFLPEARLALHEIGEFVHALARRPAASRGAAPVRAAAVPQAG